ncbi:MAG: helix-turn-helix domain-containing protein [Thermomicrobiales bacterium]
MDLLTVKETARELRVSPITVRRYIASGKLRAERVGRGIRVRREAIEDFVTPVVAQQASLEQFHWSHRPPNYAEEDLVEISSQGGVVWVLVDRLDEYLDEHGKDGNPFGDFIGIGRSGGPTNIAEHKAEYIADAILASSHDDGDLVEVVSPSSPNGVEFVPEHLLGKPTTEDDPLWDIVGIASSDEPNDVASNKHKYLADAILANKSME